jgi:RNA polymerase sigma factor (sigma-70 family)
MADDRPPTEAAAELLARWQKSGDREALDELLRIEVGILSQRLRATGRSPRGSVSASDVAQEAVLGLLRVRTAPRFEDPRALRSYLWRAAVRRLGARMRTRRAPLLRLDATATRSAASALATTGGAGTAEQRDLAAGLTLAMNLLEESDREILGLVYFEGLNAEEASTRLSLTHEAARKRLTRARAKLAKKLGDWSELIG